MSLKKYMKTYLRYLILAVIFLLTSANRAQEELSGYAAPFLRMDLGARGLALGGAMTACEANGTSFYYNPALLPDIKDKTLFFSYRQLSLDRYFRVVSFSHFLKPSGGISIGWISSGVGEITGRDFSGNSIGSIDCSENAFYFSFGLKPAEKISIGISGKILRAKLYTLTSNNFAMDFGVFFKPVKNISVGIQAKDLNGKYSWDSSSIFERGSKTYDKIPRSLNLGVNYRNENLKFNFYGGATFYSTCGKIIRAGIEKDITEILVIRSGFFNKSFGTGIGIKLNIFKKGGFIDYAVVSIKNDPSVSHVFSLNIGL